MSALTCRVLRRFSSPASHVLRPSVAPAIGPSAHRGLTVTCRTKVAASQAPQTTRHQVFPLLNLRDCRSVQCSELRAVAKVPLRGLSAMVDVVEDRSEVTITERCAQRVLKVNPDGFLRISVDGGGCSGFQYKFELVDAKEEDDVELHKAGARILVDETSMEFLRGSTLDFVEEMISSSFQVVNNPNSESSCGCGSSFAPKM